MRKACWPRLSLRWSDSIRTERTCCHGYSSPSALASLDAKEPCWHPGCAPPVHGGSTTALFGTLVTCEVARPTAAEGRRVSFDRHGELARPQEASRRGLE